QGGQGGGQVHPHLATDQQVGSGGGLLPPLRRGRLGGDQDRPRVAGGGGHQPAGQVQAEPPADDGGRRGAGGGGAPPPADRPPAPAPVFARPVARGRGGPAAAHEAGGGPRGRGNPLPARRAGQAAGPARQRRGPVHAGHHVRPQPPLPGGQF